VNLNKEGYTAVIFLIVLIVVGAFVATHHREQTTCKQTPEGYACGFKWKGNK
jgi:hypothetical protein